MVNHPSMGTTEILWIWATQNEVDEENFMWTNTARNSVCRAFIRRIVVAGSELALDAETSSSNHNHSRARSFSIILATREGWSCSQHFCEITRPLSMVAFFTSAPSFPGCSLKGGLMGTGGSNIRSLQPAHRSSIKVSGQRIFRPDAVKEQGRMIYCSAPDQAT